MESHFVALELLDTKIEVLFMNTLSVDTIWPASDQPNLLALLQLGLGAEDPDPVFLYSGLSAFGKEEE